MTEQEAEEIRQRLVGMAVAMKQARKSPRELAEELAREWREKISEIDGAYYEKPQTYVFEYCISELLKKFGGGT